MLTRPEIERALPPSLKSAATDAFVAQVNNIANDPLLAEQIRNNFISYTAVLKEGKFKTEDYLHAVTFVSYRLMKMSNHDAYMRTFPNRYQALLAKGTTSKDIAGYVSAYSRGKLVNLILEQSLVPTWVLNQDIYQEAINVQADLMRNANSEKVRSDAANSILTQLKKPDAHNFQLSIDTKESSGMTELKESLRLLAEKQRELIEGGIETKLIAASPLIEGEFKDA